MTAHIDSSRQPSRTVPTTKLLTFVLDDVRYGLEVKHVVEIIGIQRITRVPERASFVRGVINLRGRVIPVIDVRLRFGLPERAYDSRTCIVVARVGDANVGLIVDTVHDVIDVSLDDIEPVPAASNGAAGDLVASMARASDAVIVILAVHRLAASAA